MGTARALLDQFLGQVQGAQGGGQGAAPGAGLGGMAGSGEAGGGLGNLAGGLSGGVSGGLDQVRQAAGGLDLQGMLQGKGGLLAGAAAGGLAGLLLGGKKKPRKLAGTALKVGGVALVGGLAYKAWRDWQANKTPEPAPAAPTTPAAQTPPALPSPEGTAFLPDNEAEQDDLSRDLIRAMIAAAKADGHIDDAERQRIATQLDSLELDAADKAFIESELARPLDIGAVADAAKSPEHAAEIYAASLLAVDPSGAAEKGYLAMLAARLKLEPGLVAHLHTTTQQVAQ